MANELVIEKLQPKNLSQLDLESLKNEQVIARIEELADDGQYVYEPMSAREFYEGLEELMKKYAGQINGTQEYARLDLVMKKLLWQALPVLEKKIKEKLLSDNLIFTIKSKIEISANIEAYLYIYEFGTGPDNEERQMFIYSLIHNAERLGNDQLVLKSGDIMAPYISNWIKDFSSYTDSENVLKGESYELTQYLYSSSNVKKLNPDDKQVLAYVINIYNHLRHPKYIPVIEPPETQQRPQIIAPAPKPVASVPKSPVVPVPKPAPVAPKPVPVTASVHGQDLDVLKKRVEQVVPSPSSGAGAPPSPARGEGKNEWSKEIKREVSTPELMTHEELELPASPSEKLLASQGGPAHKLTNPSPGATRHPLPVGEGNPPHPVQSAPKMNLTSLASISLVDDLKKIEIGHLRQGTLPQQTQTIKSKIVNLAQANRLLPYYTVNAFEQSPLFRAYLSHGQSKFTGSPATNDLSQAEFEAIADLRKEIERL